MGRLQTLCDDGTRAVSTYNKTMQRWESTVVKSRKPICTVRMDPITKQMRVHCH